MFLGAPHEFNRIYDGMSGAEGVCYVGASEGLQLDGKLQHEM